MSQPLRSRFNREVNKAVQAFTASLPYDRRLYRQDIAGSVAHARMLARQGIITDKDAELIIMGLSSIREEIEQGKFVFKNELEDIHMSIEARLTEKIGDTAKKLHTARSRNDQVATDLRLYAKEVIVTTLRRLGDLQRALVDLAESNHDVIMPGYTHLQRAQPVLLPHHLLAYFEMLERDKDRFEHALDHADVMPLGSGALAGVPYPIDRDFVAQELGFSKISQNSLDAVSDRDFVLEYEAAASIAVMHLSRLAEEIILWSSAEFDFIEVDDAFATGSSMMPQKKNPDVAELVRGKTGRVYGHLMGLLTTLKGLPLSYNRDLQEDKEGFFDTVDTLLSSLEVFTGMIGTLKVKAGKMRQASEGSYTLATDIADYLVKKGLAFREAYSIVGSLVKYCVEKEKGFSQLSIKEYRQFSSSFAEDVLLITVETSVKARMEIGGTAPSQVAEALKRAKQIIEDN